MEISEWVAVVSVVIALLSLAVQQYLTRKQNRAEARDRHYDRTQALLMRALDDPELLEAIGGQSGGDQKLRRYCQLWLNHIEMIFRNRSLFGGRHWKGTLFDLRDFMTTPPLLDHWQENKHFYAEDFRVFMDQEVVEKEVELPRKETPPLPDQASTT